MSLEDTLYSTLATDNDVAGLVGDGGSPEFFRIFKGTPPQGTTTLPYITIYVVVGTRISSFSGLSGELNKRVQVDCYAATWRGARDLADHVYDAVDTGMSIGASPTEQYIFEDDTEIHRIMIDFSLWV